MKLSETQKGSLAGLITDLYCFKDRIESIDYNYHKDDFKKVMSDFWAYIRAYNDAETVEFFKNTKEFNDLSAFFKKSERFYERVYETNEVSVITSNILNQRDSLLDVLQNKFIEENFVAVREEFNLIKNTKGKQLVMVGCGPLPETLLLFSPEQRVSGFLIKRSG